MNKVDDADAHSSGSACASSAALGRTALTSFEFVEHGDGGRTTGGDRLVTPCFNLSRCWPQTEVVLVDQKRSK